MPSLRPVALALVLPIALSVADRAAAQDDAETPDRLLDVHQGPVISSGRVLGMGGAFTGIAEGADGHLANPAAFAVRAAPFAHEWFDYDFVLSGLSVSNDDRIDIDQSGEQTTATLDSADYLALGFNLKFGRHGIGAHGQSQRYQTRFESEDVTIAQNMLGVGYATIVDADRLWLGALLHLNSVRVSGSQALAVNISTASAGALFGVLYAPPGDQWRVGASYRTKRWGIKDDPSDEPRIKGLVVPWELAAGVSYLLGPRQYNIRPTFGEGAAPQGPFARRYTLLSADLVMTGKAPKGAIGLTSFATKEPRESGRYVDLALRLGAESEIVDGILILRGGAYFEPDRFAPLDGRLHLTGGWDIHIGELIWDWEVSLAIDWAPDYLNWGLGLGLWY